MEFGVALFQGLNSSDWGDHFNMTRCVKQLYWNVFSHQPLNSTLYWMFAIFKKEGSGEGKLHFKLHQQQFLFKIRCIIFHLSQNSLLPQIQTRGDCCSVKSGMTQMKKKKKTSLNDNEKINSGKIKKHDSFNNKSMFHFKTHVIFFVHYHKKWV